jgi:hypothetical protein
MENIYRKDEMLAFFKAYAMLYYMHESDVREEFIRSLQFYGVSDYNAEIILEAFAAATTMIADYEAGKKAKLN